jgi:hypothetical protein
VKSILALAALAIVPSSLPVVAQLEADWKVLACTLETPQRYRGVPLTLWFSESGQIFSNGKTLAGNVSPAEIAFEISGVNWKISRVTGRFAMTAKASDPATGTCMSAAAPKF